MKKHTLLFTILFSLFTTVITAQDKLTPLLEEDTFAVVHIDFTQLDTTAIFNNNRAFLEKTFADLGISREDLHKLVLVGVDNNVGAATLDFDEIWQRAIGIVEGGKTMLTDMLGVKEAFLVMGFGKIFPAFSYVAIPMTPDLNVEMLKQMLSMNPAVSFRETDEYFVMSISLPGMRLSDDMKASIAANLGPKRPVTRPDLLAAYDVVKDDPVQILFAPPQYVKRIVAELSPGLPEHVVKALPALREVNIATLVNGLRFKAVGLNPEAGRLHAVVETETELDAQILAKQVSIYWDTANDIFIKYLEELDERKKSDEGSLGAQEEIMLSFYPEIFNRESLTRLKDAALPNPEGNRFTVQWDRETAGEYLSTSGLVLMKLIQVNVEAAREASRRMQCANNMKMMGLAWHTYADAHRNLAPTYLVDENGKQLHSWRVVLLPYLENTALYEAIRLDEPWDSEFNRQFHDKMPSIFRCPSCTLGDPKRDATYCMVVGEESLGRADGTAIKMSNISDGTSNTIAFVERKTPVCWMAPEDVTFDDAVQGVNQIPTGIGSEHAGGATISLCDGSVHFISNTLDLKTLRALLTIAGGESVRLP